LEQLQAALQSHEYTPEQIAETLMHVLYPQLSAGASNTYRRLGRGAVVVDLRNLAGGALDTTYAPLAMVRRLNAEIGLLGDAEAAVESYDPDREFVVVVWQEALIMVYRLAQL
jgi:hypothetical protein